MPLTDKNAITLKNALTEQKEAFEALGLAGNGAATTKATQKFEELETLCQHIIDQYDAQTSEWRDQQVTALSVGVSELMAACDAAGRENPDRPKVQEFQGALADSMDTCMNDIVYVNYRSAERTPEGRMKGLKQMALDYWGTDQTKDLLGLVRRENGKTLTEEELKTALRQDNPALFFLDPQDMKPHKLVFSQENGGTSKEFHASWEILLRPALPPKPSFLKRMFNFLFHFADVQAYDHAVEEQQSYDSIGTFGENLRQTVQKKEIKDQQQKKEEADQDPMLKEFCRQVDEKVNRNPNVSALGDLAKEAAKRLFQPDESMADENRMMDLARVVTFKLYEQEPKLVDLDHPSQSVKQVYDSQEFIGSTQFFADSFLPTQPVNTEKLGAFLSGESTDYQKAYMDDIEHELKYGLPSVEEQRQLYAQEDLEMKKSGPEEELKDEPKVVHKEIRSGPELKKDQDQDQVQVPHI